MRLLGSFMVLGAAIAAYSQPNGSVVPFVGCKSDGQTGPVEAPRGEAKKVSIPAAMASRLAYYQSQFGLGVLGPRGWHCFGTYGSSGSGLFVSPTEIVPRELFSSSWKGFEGPVIQIDATLGEMSGRFVVARTIARVFPAHSAFVRGVIAEGIEPSAFPLGPYPQDKLRYLSDEMVEYETPANSEGLGTASNLIKGNDPISGVIILSRRDWNLVALHIRVPPRSLDLVHVIVHEAERGKSDPR